MSAEQRTSAGGAGTIALIGATGAVGSHVSRALAGRRAVRVLVHSERSADLLAGSGFELVRGDLDDPRALERATAGAARLLVVSPGGPSQVDRELAAIGAAIAGGSLEHVVKVSSIAAGVDPVPAIARAHAKLEREIAGLPVAATLLRPASFMSNLLANSREIAAGRIAMPAGPTRLPFVDPRDIGEIAAALLTSTAPLNGPLELTGPEELGFGQIAEKIGAALGIEVAYDDADPERWQQSRIAAGMPPAMAAALAESLSQPQLHERPLGEAQHRLLGRPARSFDRWLADGGAEMLRATVTSV